MLVGLSGVAAGKALVDGRRGTLAPCLGYWARNVWVALPIRGRAQLLLAWT